MNEPSAMQLGFSGHQGLTDLTSERVRLELQAIVSRLPAVVGICSLAEGSDQLFAEAILDAGGSLYVVIPCQKYESTFDDDLARRQYRTLLRKALRIETLDHEEPSEQSFWDAGRRVVDLAERVIAVWNGEPAGGLGGTADVVRYARQHDKGVTIVWPPGASRK